MSSGYRLGLHSPPLPSHELKRALLASVGKIVCLFLALLTSFTPLESQGPERLPRRARVFLDCQTTGCDFDHFRREIQFLDWVNDRADADVQALITSQPSGSGRTFEISLIGLGAFEGQDATLGFDSSDTDTEDERRDGLTRALELELVRFAGRSSEASRLSVEYSPDDLGSVEDAEPSPQERDPWDFWVFSTSVGGEYSGESRERSGNIYFSLDANRTTESLKIEVNGTVYYEEDQFELDDGTFTSIARESSAALYMAFTVRSNFATGVRADVWSSTYENVDLAARLAWGIEYNVFPYAESTRRQLTFLYTLGLNDSSYLETTIYNVLRERVPDHALQVSLDLREPWGNANISVDTRQYLHDTALYRITGRGGIDIRLFRGFSVGVGASYSTIRDQIGLRAGDATPEEILLYRRELATDYRASMSLGVTYRFGSIFNNVVNPRMSGFLGP